MNMLCSLNLHKFDFPPHDPPRYELRFRVACARGCGARSVLECVDADDHWLERHPEPYDPKKQ